MTTAGQLMFRLERREEKRGNNGRFWSSSKDRMSPFSSREAVHSARTLPRAFGANLPSRSVVCFLFIHDSTTLAL